MAAFTLPLSAAQRFAPLQARRAAGRRVGRCAPFVARAAVGPVPSKSAIELAGNAGLDLSEGFFGEPSVLLSAKATTMRETYTTVCLAPASATLNTGLTVPHSLFSQASSRSQRQVACHALALASMWLVCGLTAPRASAPQHAASSRSLICP